MLHFENPEYLYFLIAIPLLLILYIFSRILRRKRLNKIGNSSLINALTLGVSSWRPNTKFALGTLAFAFIVIMQARPQMGMKIETKKHNGIEMMVALDVSNSMIANDIAPCRLEKAKNLLSHIADKLNNDKIGLVVYAGDAFIQLPITSDMVSVKMFLDAISPSMVATQGTNIGEAISLCMNSFTKKKHVERAIVVITDGEDHEGKAEEMAEEAAKKGIHVYLLGIGTEKGSTIPINAGKDYMRDREGNVVLTKLNVDMCKKIATKGKGVFINVDNTNIAQDRLYYELNKLEQQDLGETSFSEYNEHFQAFAFIALILLVIEIIILEKSNPKLSRFNFFRKYEK